MKFGKQLEEYELPEWRPFYIQYRQLKNDLRAIKSADSPVPPGKTLSLRRTSSAGDSIVATCSSDAEEGQQLPPGGRVERQEEWRKDLEDQAKRVGHFVQRCLDGLQAQLEDLEHTMRRRLKDRKKVEGNGSPSLSKVIEEVHVKDCTSPSRPPLLQALARCCWPADEVAAGRGAHVRLARPAGRARARE